MRKRTLAVALVIGAVGMLPATVAQARTKRVKGPLCVERTVGKLHVQVGYCPGR